MSQEINFSDLNEVQKEQYIKYILENNIPLHEDSSKKEIVAEIKLQTSQKKIIQKYTTLKNEQTENNQNNTSPLQKQQEQREYQSNANMNRNIPKSINLLYQSTPNHHKHNDNKENENKGRQPSKSPTPGQRSASPFSGQPLNKNSSNISLAQKRLFTEEINVQQNKTPNKQKANYPPSSILKEINHNTREGMTQSDNKSTIIQRNQKENANFRQSQTSAKQKGNEEQQYIPSTLRKKSIKEEQGEREVKRSISPNQQKSRSASQYQIYSAKGAFTQQVQQQKTIKQKDQNSRDNSTNKRGFTLETCQDPFNLTLSTINSKNTNSKYTNFTTDCSLLNKSTKNGNILVVDHSGSDNHSQSTSSSSSNSCYQNQNNFQSSTLNQKQLPKPNGKNKMNEIYDVLKSVGFCPNNTNGSEWQSITGGEMRSDPQELSVKLDTRNLFMDSILGDDSQEDRLRKGTPSPKIQHKFGYQSDYLKILNQHENIKADEANNKSPQNRNSLSPFRVDRGRKMSILNQTSPVRQSSIPATITTPKKSLNNANSPQKQIQRDKSCGYNQQDGYNSHAQKEFKIKSSIMELFKNKFIRLTKIPSAHMHSQIEEIYAAKEASIQKSSKYCSKKQGPNNFKEFVYDFYLKKYKNNLKITESSLFNFIGSVEYHSENSDSLAAKQFLQMINDEYTEDQIQFYLSAFSEIQLTFKQRSLQYVHLSEKTIFKISLKLFNSPQEQPLCYEIIELVSQQEQYAKSQAIGVYNYLEILMQVYQSSIGTKDLNDQKQLDKMEQNIEAKNKRRNSHSSHSPPLNQKPFAMINESFGVQNDMNNIQFLNQLNKDGIKMNQGRNNSKEKGDKKQNNLKSILQNKDYQSERISQNIVKQTDFFFSNQYEDLQQQQMPVQSSLRGVQRFYCDKNAISQSCPSSITQIQQIQSALFAEMEKIVIEFVQMFEVTNRQSSLKLEEMILKKCKYLVMSLILKEQNKWFELLLIDYPNYQQKMQAETIQKLYEAYERSFIQNNSSCSENKNLRSLCKLILKVPELNDAISKLLICVLVPES